VGRRRSPISSAVKTTAFPLERRVPVILHGVVRTTVEKTSDRRPFVTELLVRARDRRVFLRGKRPVLDLRRKLVAPP